MNLTHSAIGSMLAATSAGAGAKVVPPYRHSRPTALLLLAGVLALLAGGCGSTDPMTGTPSIARALPSGGGPATMASQVAGVAHRPAGMPAASRGYTLGPGDKLRIMVFNEQEMSREYEVDGAGSVTLALIGAVPASGRSPAELQESIRTALAQGFIKEPRVSVEVVSYRPFYIIGEVQKAGEYPYKSGMNVISAVAVAGGYSYRAATGTAYVRRANTNTEERVDPATGVLIYPGDIVRIPERLF